jgi:DNA-binding LacI/PurR family transcriptional regulator
VARGRPVTLIDVARAAGVSRTTASAALGGSGRLSPETRDRVAAVAARLGYEANPVARHLRRGRMGAIGLHLPEQATGLAYYMEFAFGAVERAREEGVAVTLLAPAAPARVHVDGFVVVDPLRDDPVVAALLASGQPVVSGERLPGEEPQAATVVASDHERGLRELLDHVAARGAAAPSLIAPDEASAWAHALRSAYRGWCAQRGVAPLVRDVAFNASPEEVRLVAGELLAAGRAHDGPIAIVSAPDGAALGTVAAARDAGLEVGREVLAAACVDSAAMAFASPPITALNLHPRSFGRRCVTALLALLAGERPAGASLRQPVDLVVRASTAGG